MALAKFVAAIGIMKDKLDSIASAIEEIKRGNVIIVVDDEDRENEGDFVASAEHATPELINFMATHGRGLICAPLVEDRCDELGLELMVSENSASYETPFTISVDLIGHGCTTGISASDRSKTVQALIDPKIKSEELGRPGHIFPLRAKMGGVLRRAGHTEAAVDLARLAGHQAAGVIVEIMNEDGSMARLPQLYEIADKFDLKIISIRDLIAYRLANETLIEKVLSTSLPTKYGDFTLHAFRQTTNNAEHLALTKGSWTEDEPVLVRVHSSSLIGDVFGSESFGRGEQLHKAMEMIEESGTGAIVYINKFRPGRSVVDDLNLYREINEKKDYDGHTIPAKMDTRDYGVGAQILRNLGVRKIKLITNNKERKTGAIGYGLEIVEKVSVDLVAKNIKA